MESEKLTELIRQRLELLCALSAEIADAHKALVAVDLDAIEDNRARQEILCGKLKELDREIARLRPAPGVETDQAFGGSLSVCEMRTAEAAVRLNNQRQAALWRSLRRTMLAIQACLPSDEAGLYEPPRNSQTFWMPAGKLD